MAALLSLERIETMFWVLVNFSLFVFWKKGVQEGSNLETINWMKVPEERLSG